MRQFEIADGFTIGGRSPLFFIMGPCVIEDEATALNTLEALVRLTEGLKLRFVFKASYDKANRTSVKSFRGPGLKKGVKVFKKAKKEFPGVPILTDVHCRYDVKEVAEAVDIIQIPAFLCRQTDLILEAAKTKRIVNIKKGQFMSPASIRNSIDKALSAGNNRIIVTERGVSFGYNNLVVDYRAIPEMREMGFPVVFDATHSVQTPGGLGVTSGGDRAMAGYLARAAAAVGVDGIFMEVHPDPDKALCDGPNSIRVKDLKGLLRELSEIDALVKGF